MSDKSVQTISQAVARMKSVEEEGLAVLLWANQQLSQGRRYSNGDLRAVQDRADTIASKATALRILLEKMKPVIGR